jgi:hypothetical protein
MDDDVMMVMVAMTLMMRRCREGAESDGGQRDCDDGLEAGADVHGGSSVVDDQLLTSAAVTVVQRAIDRPRAHRWDFYYECREAAHRISGVGAS